MRFPSEVNGRCEKAEKRNEREDIERERGNKFQERLSLVKIGFRGADGLAVSSILARPALRENPRSKKVELGRDKP
jgi:hypothetical protein